MPPFTPPLDSGNLVPTLGRSFFCLAYFPNDVTMAWAAEGPTDGFYPGPVACPLKLGTVCSVNIINTIIVLDSITKLCRRAISHW